jgi:hypothetical protein
MYCTMYCTMYCALVLHDVLCLGTVPWYCAVTRGQTPMSPSSNLGSWDENLKSLLRNSFINGTY